MVIDCISDLHGEYPELEGGDLLIVAGDITARDTEYEYAEEFIPWLIDQHMTKYKQVVWIGGNHDNWVQKHVSPQEQFVGGEYLCDSGTEFEGLKIWGSPWTKTFEGMNPHCKSFTVDTEEELDAKWALIPKDTDILITHSPPFSILDEVRNKWKYGVRCGSSSLYEVLYKERVKPKLHVFGHIHGSYGKATRMDMPGVQFVNASHMNEDYEPVNPSIRIVL